MNAMATQETICRSGSPVVRLREIARLCESREPLDPFLAQWLGEVLNTFFEHETTSLEEIMGLRYGRGGLPWRRAEAMRERDAALRALSSRFYAGRSPCARSGEIAALAARYGASAWLIDRNHATMPEHYAGTPHAFLWRAFRSGATMPLGERQIRNIVGG
ncbi:MAG: hypothetical protein OEN55_01215 [Alphaproteobacteria bacterium]|nr:hypothetical protein [Alphaproteobacteria bacterium]